MDIVEAPPRRRRIPRWLVPAVGYTVSAASLVSVFWKFSYAQFGDDLRKLDWTLAAAAIIIEILVYFFDAWRWRVLLRPVGKPSFAVCLQAIFVGLFANDVLPARAGELIRCFLLSYESKVPLSLAFTSEFILRIMDGLWIVIIYLLVTFQIGSHQVINGVMWAFGIGTLVVASLTLFVLFRRHHALHFVRNRVRAARFVHLLDEIHRLGHWPELRAAMGISGLYWLAQAVTVWALLRADNFDLGLTAASFLLVVKAIFTLIPAAPANVGAYQQGAMYALTLLLSERVAAQSFAEIMFWLLTLPIAIGGAIAVARAGVDITALHRRAHEARETGDVGGAA